MPKTNQFAKTPNSKRVTISESPTTFIWPNCNEIGDETIPHFYECSLNESGVVADTLDVSAIQANQDISELLTSEISDIKSLNLSEIENQDSFSIQISPDDKHTLDRNLMNKKLNDYKSLSEGSSEKHLHCLSSQTLNEEYQTALAVFEGMKRFKTELHTELSTLQSLITYSKELYESENDRWKELKQCQEDTLDSIHATLDECKLLGQNLNNCSEY